MSQHFFPPTPSKLLAKALEEAGDGIQSRGPTNDIVKIYLEPLKKFAVWQWRYSFHDAEDLVQSFQIKFLEGSFLRYSATEGKFRTYLLTCFTRFHISSSRRSKALKRGGGKEHLTLDDSIVSELSVPSEIMERTAREFLKATTRQAKNLTEKEFEDKWPKESVEIISRAMTESLSEDEMERICKLENISRSGVSRRISKVRLSFARNLRKCFNDLGEDPAELLGEHSIQSSLMDTE